MLFNDPVFLFAFLPITLLGFALLARLSQKLTMAWLVFASIFFYGWWNPRYVPLLLGSIAVNYSLGVTISRSRPRPAARQLLAVGVGLNLLLLAYFKYANFFVSAAASMFRTDWNAPQIILPLAISFFTFTEIAYLVDVARGKAEESSFLSYALFVTFFPHLIAGPIVHHRQVIPQFQERPLRFKIEDFTVGLTLFLLGLFKKVLIADAFSFPVGNIFGQVHNGYHPTLFDAWGAVLSFALQLYFDFSGYSDMAMGLARMFGIRFPVNFNSPYKATSIIDFWRRWHITLSEFLRDYLYIPLGGSRRGKVRRYINLLLTMLLGGLWHGAGWTFVFWGGLHGLYLCINHGWRALWASRPEVLARWDTPVGRWAGRLLTFGAVLIAWVFFKAEGLATVGRMLAGMSGSYGHARTPLMTMAGLAKIVLVLGIAWFLPNTQEFMADADPALEPVENRGRLRWRGPSLATALVLGLLLTVVVKGLFAAEPSDFLYFHF